MADGGCWLVHRGFGAMTGLTLVKLECQLTISILVVPTLFVLLQVIES